MEADRIKEIEGKIEELKARWPAHSPRPSMLMELEELEDELKEARRRAEEVANAGETGNSRLP